MERGAFSEWVCTFLLVVMCSRRMRSPCRTSSISMVSFIRFGSRKSSSGLPSEFHFFTKKRLFSSLCAYAVTCIEMRVLT